MNICDDDDNIMEFLTHDEDDNFTGALIIISNNLEEDSDDDDGPALVLPHVRWSCSRVGKAPNIERCCVFTCISFLFILGVQLPSTTQQASRSFSRFQSDSSMIMCRRWLQTTTTPDRKRMLLVRWDCRFRKSARLIVSWNLESVLQNTMTSIACWPWLAWKPWSAFVIRLLQCIKTKPFVTRMLLTLDDSSRRDVLLASLVAKVYLIVCIGSGKTVFPVGKGCFKESLTSRQLFWMPKQITVVNFGISISVLQGHWMISTSWTALPCLTMPFVVNLLLLILLSIGVHSSVQTGAMLALLKRLRNLRLDAKNVCIGAGGKEEEHWTSVWNAPCTIPYPDLCLLSLGTSCNEDSHPEVCDSSQSWDQLRTSEWSQFWLH